MKKNLLSLLFVLGISGSFLIGCSPLFTTTSSSTTTSSFVKELVGIVPVDDNVYTIGQVYSKVGETKYYYLYNDGSMEETEVSSYSRVFLSDPVGESFEIGKKFNRAGTYTLNVSGTKDKISFNENIEIHVIGGYEAGAAPLEISNVNSASIYKDGEMFFDKLDLTFDVNWQDLGLEHVTYNSNMSEYKLSLFETDNLSNNVINKPLDGTKNYVLDVSINNIHATTNLDFYGEYSFVKPESMSILASDVDHEYAPALGEVKVLVVPIELEPGSITNYYSWDDEYLANTETYFFGKKEDTPNQWNSFKSYYETASFGNVSISGMIADVYYETDPTLTMDAVAYDYSYANLFKMIENAINWLEETSNNIDWDEYDLNDDGCLDSVHFITNAPYMSNTTLWPHMYKTNKSGTIDRPVANVYSMSSLAHMGDARTQIHEQGHMFGLADYYDYTYSGRDYVGQADMQSHNYFDWNSFSKMSVGWVTPYVYDGKANRATITIGSASLTGDCLLIPANYDTWNGSAYDEYFLIELFTPDGNNKNDWQTWSNFYGDLGEYGVRMYHVDARLWGYNYGNFNGGAIVDSISGYDLYQYACNNSFDASDYATHSPNGYEQYKLLTLLQSNASNSFGKAFGNKSLTNEDLFHTGDEFNFEDFASYLIKSGSTPSTMDNGEYFPYTIKFNSVTKDSATITITKN